MRILRSATIFITLALAPPASAIVGPSVDGAGYLDRVVMVLIRGAEGSGFCSGVALAPHVILTAAHCLRPTEDMLILYRDDADQPIVIRVAATSAHPMYRADAIRRRVVSIDAALIETAEPLPARFRAAMLAEGDPPPIGTSAIVVGFGIAREGEAKTGGALRAAKLRVRAPASHVLLWAADPDGLGGGGCAGDSGAPIFGPDGEAVVAIVAWTSGARGRKCGDVTQGPLVAPLRGWIDATMARWRE